ncbi:head GIN domain-containing protein [Maritalea myrionectae]|uniref:head GIN domain-containing protein n=1 Tax=Maritalea myrionectae TaxID=454601 RepID=UPI000416D20B|nr:head GIN domain-containing protein [Maritalea myrionectae]
MRNTSSRATTQTAHFKSTRLLATVGALGLALGAFFVASNPAFADETREYDFADFSKIEISESVEGSLVQSNSFSIQATAADKELLDSLVIEKTGTTLKIHRKEESLLKSLTSLFGGQSPKVVVTMPFLSAAHASAGAELMIETFSTENIELLASSGADLDAKGLTAISVKADSSSGADIELAGTCDQAEFSSSSGADLDAGSLECNSVLVDASSGADASVFASDNLEANASSGADINVRGNPSTTQTNTSSGGEIELK